MERKEFHFLPVSIDISGRKILIIGGGKVGYHKSLILNRYTDEATVLSETFHEGFEKLPFRLIRKSYEPEDLKGVGMVYICTENHELNARIKQDAERYHVLASVCDNPALCDFVSPAVYKDGDLTIAVGSNAKDVHRSIRVRNAIREAIEKGLLDVR